MKIKECCKNVDNGVCLTDFVNDKKIKKKVPCIWYIPLGCYEEEGVNVKVKYCPFCGTKIEVEE